MAPHGALAAVGLFAALLTVVADGAGSCVGAEVGQDCAIAGDDQALMQLRTRDSVTDGGSEAAAAHGATPVTWRFNHTHGCDRNALGTCASHDECSASRGAAECRYGRCYCHEGYCALGGTCFPMSPALCEDNSGGTCMVESCSRSHGATYCHGGSCLCAAGTCAWKGRCLPVTDTGGTCHMASCSASRGKTACVDGRCLCQDGHVSVGGRCVDPQAAALLLQLSASKPAAPPAAPTAAAGRGAGGDGRWSTPTWEEVSAGGNASNDADEIVHTPAPGEILNKDTGGRCYITDCAQSRHAVCSDGKCMCREGHYARDGKCYSRILECVRETGGMACGEGVCSQESKVGYCDGDRCLCAPGTCFLDGQCWPVTNTGGTCSEVSNCGATRGATICHHSKCLCQDGYVAVHGACKPL